MSLSTTFQLIGICCSFLQISFSIVFYEYFTKIYYYLGGQDKLLLLLSLIYLMVISINGVFGLAVLLFYDLIKKSKFHYLLNIIKVILQIGMYGLRFPSLFFGILSLLFSNTKYGNLTLDLYSKTVGYDLILVAITGLAMELICLLSFPFNKIIS